MRWELDFPPKCITLLSVMIVARKYLKHIVAAFLFFAAVSPVTAAEETRLDQLYAQLQEQGLPNWKTVEEEIWLEWSKSGSPAMDLLLKRGRDAMEKGTFDVAIEHLTALVDHAPGFAEAYNARATAYFRTGLYGPALADIQQTLALNPRHFGALTGLGTIMEELEQTDKALGAYGAAHAIHPNDPDLKEALDRLTVTVTGVTL